MTDTLLSEAAGVRRERGVEVGERSCTCKRAQLKEIIAFKSPSLSLSVQADSSGVCKQHCWLSGSR